MRPLIKKFLARFVRPKGLARWLIIHLGLSHV